MPAANASASAVEPGLNLMQKMYNTVSSGLSALYHTPGALLEASGVHHGGILTGEIGLLKNSFDAKLNIYSQEFDASKRADGLKERRVHKDGAVSRTFEPSQTNGGLQKWKTTGDNTVIETFDASQRSDGLTSKTRHQNGSILFTFKDGSFTTIPAPIQYNFST